MIRRMTTTVLALAILTACGGGDGGPSGPTGPDIRGTYSGSPPQGGHSFSIRIGDEDPTVIQCPGAMVVTSSSGGSFAGSLRLDPCPLLQVEQAISIPITSGTVQENGSVRYVVAGQDAIIQGLQEEGCELLEADEAFTGQVDDATFTAAIQATVECTDVEGDVEVTWSFQGSLGA